VTRGEYDLVIPLTASGRRCGLTLGIRDANAKQMVISEAQLVAFQKRKAPPLPSCWLPSGSSPFGEWIYSNYAVNR